jgi:hypothetical protein
MRDALIGDAVVDYLELGWQEELTPRQLAARFQAWLNDSTFIERKLPDLKEAAFCQLFISPSQGFDHFG